MTTEVPEGVRKSEEASRLLKESKNICSSFRFRLWTMNGLQQFSSYALSVQWNRKWCVRDLITSDCFGELWKKLTINSYSAALSVQNNRFNLIDHFFTAQFANRILRLVRKTVLIHSLLQTGVLLAWEIGKVPSADMLRFIFIVRRQCVWGSSLEHFQSLFYSRNFQATSKIRFEGNCL